MNDQSRLLNRSLSNLKLILPFTPDFHLHHPFPCIVCFNVSLFLPPILFLLLTPFLLISLFSFHLPPIPMILSLVTLPIILSLATLPIILSLVTLTAPEILRITRPVSNLSQHYTARASNHCCLRTFNTRECINSDQSQ